jgi:hypothetical protein
MTVAALAAACIVAGAAAASLTSPSYGTSWAVKAVASTYSVLNVTAGGASYIYVLTQRGAAAPTEAALGSAVFDAATFITVPVAKVALLSTTQIPFVEVSGGMRRRTAMRGTQTVRWILHRSRNPRRSRRVVERRPLPTVCAGIAQLATSQSGGVL